MAGSSCLEGSICRLANCVSIYMISGLFVERMFSLLLHRNNRVKQSRTSGYSKAHATNLKAGGRLAKVGGHNSGRG